MIPLGWYEHLHFSHLNYRVRLYTCKTVNQASLHTAIKKIATALGLYFPLLYQ